MSDAAAVPQGNLCPQCGASLEAKAIACPSCGAQVAKAKPSKIELTTGQKIAAATLILNGLAMIAEAIVTKDHDAAQGLRGSLASIVIGAYLFTGRPGALTWAKVAAILGGVLFTIIHVAQADIFSAVLQVFYSLSLVGLLFGKAGTVRLVFCTLFIVAYFGLETAGIVMEATGMLPSTTTPSTTPQSAPKT